MIYNFNAKGLKLGQRVKTVDGFLRGILQSEVIHISGCNTFTLMVPNPEHVGEVNKYRTRSVDSVILTPIDNTESVVTYDKVLTDEDIFVLKDVSSLVENWKQYLDIGDKEIIPELDETENVEFVAPGAKVLLKYSGEIGIITGVQRSYMTKEVDYWVKTGVDKKFEGTYVNCHSNDAFVVLEESIIIDAQKDGKTGPEWQVDDRNSDMWN